MTRSRLRLRLASVHVRMSAQQQGMTLIEVLVAMGIIAAVAVTFLAGMTASSQRVIINSENITAESLAKTQMEFIKQQAYRVDQQYTYLTPAQIPTGYAVLFTVQLMNPRGDSQSTDDGIQKITVTVSHNGTAVHTLEGYKAFTGQ